MKIYLCIAQFFCVSVITVIATLALGIPPLHAQSKSDDYEECLAKSASESDKSAEGGGFALFGKSLERAMDNVGRALDCATRLESEDPEESDFNPNYCRQIKDACIAKCSDEILDNPAIPPWKRTSAYRKCLTHCCRKVSNYRCTC